MIQVYYSFQYSFQYSFIIALTYFPLVLDTTISTEVELIQLLKSSSDIEKRGWDVIHQHDDPFHISLLPSVSPKKVAHLLKRLDFLDQQTEDNNWQTQVCNVNLCTSLYNVTLIHSTKVFENIVSTYLF